jgi:predicted house-cleaning noncanonical NTP pyrophosphatase (MazG superfamily)
MTNHTEEACVRYIKAYKKVEKLSKKMKIEEIAQILGMGKSLVEEYRRILNEEEWLMGETNYGRSGCLSVNWEFSKNQLSEKRFQKNNSKNNFRKTFLEKTIFRIDLK